MRVKASVQIGKKLAGIVEENCPHCQSWSQFERYELLGTINYIPLPASEILQCQLCQQYARRESLLKRIFSAIFLLPFVLLLGAVIAAGGYMLWTSITNMEFSWGFLLIGTILVGVGGFFEYRLIMFIYTMLFKSKLFQLENMLTQL